MDRRVAKLEQSVAVARGPDYRRDGSVPPPATCYEVIGCDKHGHCQSSTVCVEGNSWFGNSSDESGDDSWFGGGGDDMTRNRRAKRAPKKVAAPPAPKPKVAAPIPDATTPDTPKKERKDRKKEPSPDKESSRRTRKSVTEALQQDVESKAKIQ